MIGAGPNRDSAIRFLDPAIGTGAFYSALRQSAPPARLERARGFEIDALYGVPAQDLWAGGPLHLTVGDFTQMPAPERDARFSLLICNPPYVRHHHLDRAEKRRLKMAALRTSGIPISGLAGLYAYFLALCHDWMTHEGVAAWLIPSEFMDVGYGQALKRYLLERVTLVRLHRFDPGDLQFGDALVSSAVLWLRNTLPPPDHAVEFTFGGPLARPHTRRTVGARALAQEDKWTRYPVLDVRAPDPGPRLGEFFKIQRGIATGDNKFFIMTGPEAAQRGVPPRFLRPILPSPRTLPESEIHADAAGDPLLKRPLFLLDCRLPEADVAANHPGLWDYLRTGVPTVSQRYLCSHRTPWYAQEQRPPAPFVCTYMGRAAPFRFILNHSQATAPNVYLLLYPKPPLGQALAADPNLIFTVAQILRSLRGEDLRGEGRVYGGGLHKLEPKELANVRVDSLGEICRGVAPTTPPKAEGLWKPRA